MSTAIQEEANYKQVAFKVDENTVIALFPQQNSGDNTLVAVQEMLLLSHIDNFKKNCEREV